MSGNFALAQEHFKDKAIQAMFALRKYTEVGKLPVKTAHKLFDFLIAPILTYNSEVRSAFVKHGLGSIDKTPFEKIHLKFCKYYLGISSKATNLASRAELGRFPLKILIDQNILGFVKHLGEMNNNALAKQSLLLSEELRGKKQVYVRQGLKTSLYVQQGLCEYIRKQFIAKQSQILNLTSFDDYKKLCYILFTTSNKTSIHCTAKYISKCLLLRDK